MTIAPAIRPFRSAPLSLPRVPIAFAPERARGADVRARSARVLVVEDDYFVSMEIEAVLMDLGCDVVAIPSTAEEALSIAARERPDLILMDIRLAGRMDGIEAATRIHDALGIRSLFVTAHSDPGTFARGEAANPLGWVPKPFTAHQLTTAVTAILRPTDETEG
jgi:CheY-like chemotaxis protein